MNTMEIWNYILFKIKFTSEMKFFSYSSFPCPHETLHKILKYFRIHVVIIFIS